MIQYTTAKDCIDMHLIRRRAALIKEIAALKLLISICREEPDLKRLRRIISSLRRDRRKELRDTEAALDAIWRLRRKTGENENA